MPIIISVEGNIGSGKSTLVSELKKVLPPIFNGQIYFLLEPVDEWEKICDTNGDSIITKFYNNQKKYAFSFQMMAYISRLKTLTELIDKIPQDSVIICERSVWTDKNIFAKMLYEDNNIEEEIYNETLINRERTIMDRRFMEYYFNENLYRANTSYQCY